MNHLQRQLEKQSMLIERVVHDLNNYCTLFLNISELIKDDLAGNDDALEKIAIIDDTANKLATYTKSLKDFTISKEECKKHFDLAILKDEFESWPFDKNSFVIGDEEIFQRAFLEIKDRLKDFEYSFFCENNDQNFYHFIMKISYGSNKNKDSFQSLFAPYKKGQAKPEKNMLNIFASHIFSLRGNFFVDDSKEDYLTINISFKKDCSSSQTKDTKNVLLVDDQDQVRMLIKTILEKHGYHVDSASNGVEALSLADSNNFDLLITDMVMPVMGGRELVLKLREKKDDLKVLYMSGYLEEGDDAMKEQNTGFLSKPFNKDSILKAVENVLTTSEHHPS